MKMKQFLLAFSAIVLMFSCVKNEENKQVTIKESDYFNVRTEGVQTGGIQLIPIETPIGKFKVWTKRFGNNPKQKVLLLHGGPGSTHEYFECFESFLPKEGIEFIYYDQLGSTYSDQPTDTSLWTIERFVEEVEQVRTALGLTKGNFFLLGHSWGGILAMEYALKYQDNLKGLIISNMMSSCIDYDKYAEEVLAKQMPASAVDSIRMLEAKGDFGNPKYMDILMTHFYPKHVCRMPVEQWADPMNRGLSKTNQQIYVIMQGPSEFGISGRLEKWDRKNDLKNIKVPTLIIGGTHDTMDPKHMEWMAKEVQNGSFLLCPNGSHMSMYDDQQTYMQGVINFIKQVQ
ncbi:proline iminopeptidase-family hydrolase [Thermoflexibacter ruber]